MNRTHKGYIMSRHHVKSHHWIDGSLRTIEHFFDSLEEAMAHANASTAHAVKVYNASGELQHVENPTAQDTYA